jgi:uncharacterized delta-60 repeat protein
LVGAAALALTCVGASPAAAGIADPDSSFGENGLATVPFDTPAFGSALAVGPDGTIVVVGGVDGPEGDDTALVRLLPDGTPDDSFSGDGRASFDLADGGDDSAAAVAVRPDGRIVIAGTANDKFVVAQLLSGGTLDNDFADAGVAEFGFGIDDNGRASDLALDAGGNAVVVGWADSDVSYGGQDAAVARLTPGGDLDGGFSDDGKLLTGMPNLDGWPGGVNDVASGVTILPDGDIAISGTNTTAPDGQGLYGRIDPGGVVETMRRLGSGRYYAASDITVLTGGEPLLVGSYQGHGQFEGSAAAWLVQGDGSVGSSGFNPSFDDDPLRTSASTVAPLSDGRAIVGGSIRAQSGSVERDLFLFDQEAGFVAYDSIGFGPSDLTTLADDRTLAAGSSNGAITVGRFLAPTIDAQAPPKTKIVAGPRGKVDESKVKFRFRSSPDDASFQCKLDGRRWRACESPYKVGPLEQGRHRFKVRAISQDGERDPTPAKRRFVVG